MNNTTPFNPIKSINTFENKKFIVIFAKILYKLFFFTP